MTNAPLAHGPDTPINVTLTATNLDTERVITRNISMPKKGLGMVEVEVEVGRAYLQFTVAGDGYLHIEIRGRRNIDASASEGELLFFNMLPLPDHLLKAD